MKILFCIKAMNNPGGGAERVLATLANGLAEREHEVTVLTFEMPGGQSFYPLCAQIRRIELGMGATNKPATVAETLNRLPVIRRAVLNYAPDVVVGFMHSMFIPLGLAMVGNSTPIIASEHIVPEHYQSRRWIESALLSMTPLLVERITCVSEQVRSSYPFFLRKSMVVIANPIAMSSSCPLSSQRPTLGKTLLSVGRLEPQKDHAKLVQAFGQIAEEFPEWTLKIIGDGDLRKNLESQIQALGLSDRIFLPGSTQAIEQEYAGADLFVLPSRYESFGLTVVEALSHGIPAIGFDDCLGTNQLIQPGINGLLANGTGNRVTALSQTLRQLMADDDLRRQLAHSATRNLPKYHLKDVLDCWDNLFHQVLFS